MFFFPLGNDGNVQLMIDNFLNSNYVIKLVHKQIVQLIIIVHLQFVVVRHTTIILTKGFLKMVLMGIFL
jgi:hypothetical protein